MTTTRRQFVQALGASAALGAFHPFAANAQVDQVKVYFGFPAGSSGDTVARRVAEKWAGSAFSKNPGVVENKPGAGGRIALETLKLRPPTARCWRWRRCRPWSTTRTSTAR